MNTTAIVLWAVCACVGFLVSNSLYGAVAGLTVGLTITLIADLYYENKGE